LQQAIAGYLFQTLIDSRLNAVDVKNVSVGYTVSENSLYTYHTSQLTLVLPAALRAAQSDGIKVTQGAILRFSAPQGDMLHHKYGTPKTKNFTKILSNFGI